MTEGEEGDEYKNQKLKESKGGDANVLEEVRAESRVLEDSHLTITRRRIYGMQNEQINSSNCEKSIVQIEAIFCITKISEEYCIFLSKKIRKLEQKKNFSIQQLKEIQYISLWTSLSLRGITLRVNQKQYNSMWTFCP